MPYRSIQRIWAVEPEKIEAARVEYPCAFSDGIIGVGRVLLGRLPVEGLSEGEPLCAEAHGAVSQQEEPAVLPAEVRRHLLRRDDALRPLPPRVGGREKGKVRNAETELTGKNRIIYNIRKTT